ncbi:MAG: hypothetical protein EOO07_33065, partial [Chitinophagaceae bacterium]
FWWGGRPGVNGSAKLYRITYDYLVKVKGMTNLIWVWNLQDFANLASDLNTYDPGSEYYDVLSLDVYWSDGTGLTTAKYNAMVMTGGKSVCTQIRVNRLISLRKIVVKAIHCSLYSMLLPLIIGC